MGAYQVIVAGGGLSGVASAVAAAREGLSVLLVERYGFLGGAATAALVNPFMGYAGISSGFFGELVERLDESGGMHANGVTFDEEVLKLVLAEMVTENKIALKLHSRVAAVQCDGNLVTEISCAEKSGLQNYRGEYFIDATGDGDVCAYAGCAFQFGREMDGYCQPMTLCFRLAGVNMALFDEKQMHSAYEKAKERGEVKNPRENILWFANVHEGMMHFNTTRVVKKSAISTEEFTLAELEARQQVFEMYRFLKAHVPAFENAYLVSTAVQTGVRESRRIMGEYLLTEDDLLNTVHFKDSIARGNYAIDIHNPSGAGSVFKTIPHGCYYTIPYRCLIPKGKENLLVVGRPISATHEAHSSCRIMPICTCIGQAGGLAVSIASKRSLKLPQVPADVLQEAIEKNGGLY